MNVINHTTQEKCIVKFPAYSYFTRERQKRVHKWAFIAAHDNNVFKVFGNCYDKDGVPRLSVRGYWDECFEFAPILSGEGKKAITGPYKELWRVVPRP